MTTTFLVVSSLVKVLVVLLITVGGFAPILIWAERRQSAMIQDRLGPSRAAIVLPACRRDVHRPSEAADVAPGGVDRHRRHRRAGHADVRRDQGEQSSADFDVVADRKPGRVWRRVGGAPSRVRRAQHDRRQRREDHAHRPPPPLADALKFIFKEDFVPPKADKLLFSAGPIIALIPAIAAFAVIPFASSLHWDYLNQVLPRTGEIAGAVVPMQVASINVGILFIFAIASTGIIGAAISGYASDNKYSLLGGIRAASQMVSYEVVLGLTLVPAFMVYASLRLEDMTMWQHDHVWGIFVPPLTLAAVNFFVAAVAETKRVPFDLPEGESELVGATSRSTPA